MGVSVNPPHTEDSLATRKHQSIGGWLWFFVFACVLGGVDDVVSCASWPSPLNLILTSGTIAVRIWVLSAVFRVSPNTLKAVKALLILIFLASATQIVQSFTLPASEFDVEQMRMIAGRGLVSLAVWASYFHKSQRVLLTYGGNL